MPLVFSFLFVRLAGWSPRCASCAPAPAVGLPTLIGVYCPCATRFFRLYSKLVYASAPDAGLPAVFGCILFAPPVFFFVRLAGWPSPCSTLFFFAVRANIGP